MIFDTEHFVGYTQIYGELGPVEGKFNKYLLCLADDENRTINNTRVKGNILA